MFLNDVDLKRSDIASNVHAKKQMPALRSKEMTPVGFEPTQLALVELESTPLDHSGKVSCCFGLWPNLWCADGFGRRRRPSMVEAQALAIQRIGRGESGWCSDWTSTPGAWRHAGVQFPLPGAAFEYIEEPFRFPAQCEAQNIKYYIITCPCGLMDKAPPS